MKAAIDIGSNTVLLLLGEVKDQKVDVIYEEQHAPRLGRGVDEQENLNTKSVQRVVNVLTTYQSTIDNKYTDVSDVRVLATSAVRDANNRQEFVRKVKEETGFSVQILSGEEEAELTYAGAKSVLTQNDTDAAVIDIGGGSTEIAIGTGKQMTDRYSFDIGSVRFTERYLSNNPPKGSQIEDCRSTIKKMLEMRPFEWTKDIQLIGVAGTVTSLAAIHNQIGYYDPALLNETQLSAQDISSHIATFSTMPSEELLHKYPKILKGRADVILAGLLILETFMHFYNIEHLTVSTGGIRHGALLKV